MVGEGMGRSQNKGYCMRNGYQSWITRPGDFDFNLQQFSKLIPHAQKVKRVAAGLQVQTEGGLRCSGTLALPPLFPLMGLEFGQSGNWREMLQEQHRYLEILPSTLPPGLDCFLALQGARRQSPAWDGTIDLVFIDKKGQRDGVTLNTTTDCVLFHGYAIASSTTFRACPEKLISILKEAGLPEDHLILLACEPFLPCLEAHRTATLRASALQEDSKHIVVAPAGLLGDQVVLESPLDQALHGLSGHYDLWNVESQCNSLSAERKELYLHEDALQALQLVEQTAFLLRYFLAVKGVEGVVIGLSGGLDSAMALYLAVVALGPEHVSACFMPTKFNAQASREDAQQLAKNLGVELRIIPIDDWYHQGLGLLGQGHPEALKGITQENIQARLRGVLLMGLSNQTGRWVLNTSNRSELAMGYSTLYGDAVGSLSVLGSFYKTELYRMANAINSDSKLRAHGKIVIPQRIITRPPSAELREGQKDSDSLPDYLTLDTILKDLLDLSYTVDEICQRGYPRDLVNSVVTRYRNSSYKRQQFMPILNVMARSFPDGPVVLPSQFLPL